MTNMHCEHFEEMLAQQTDGPLPLEADGPSRRLPAMPSAARRSPSHRSRRARMGQRRARPAAARVGRHRSPLAGARPDRTAQPARAGLAGMALRLVESRRAPGTGRSLRPGDADRRRHRRLPDRARRRYASIVPATTVQVSRPALDGLGSTLDGNMQRVVASFSPDYGDSVALSLQQNLRIVDNLIAVCEKTVREHPRDPLAREYLYGAYQQKADLLAVAMDRSALEIK